MKHPLETKNQFIELRAQGLTLDAISEQISVPKPTLGRWNQEYLEQIQRLRAIQWELVEDQMGQRFEDSLKRIAQRIRRLEDELDTRKPENYPRMELMRVIRQSRLEYLKLRSILMAPLQPSRGRTPCLGDLDPQKRDKTVQNTVPLDTISLQHNDLQQPEPSLSHSYGVPVSAGQMPAESSERTCEVSTERNRTEPNDLAAHRVPASAGEIPAESHNCHNSQTAETVPTDHSLVTIDNGT